MTLKVYKWFYSWFLIEPGGSADASGLGWYGDGGLGSEHLKFVDGFVGEAKEEGVAVINTTGEETVDQGGGRVGVKGGPEMDHIF